MEQKKDSVFRKIEWPLVVLTFLLFFIGLVSIASATSPAYSEELSVMQYIGSLFAGNALSQLVFFVISLVLIVALLFWDYSNMWDFTNIMYWGCVAILIAVRILGSNLRGMVGWFKLGGVTIQPAEICKPIIIIVFAKELAMRTEESGGINTWREAWPVLWRFIIPFVLICIQPDFGTAVVYAVIMFGMLFMAKTSFKVLGPMILAILVALPVGWFLISDEQQARILVFLDPTKDPLGAGYNVIRAKTVAGAGGLWGKGFFSTDLLTQRSNYLPEEQTDFIFSATVEAVGFMGGIAIILIYFCWIGRMIYLSSKAKDDFGRFIILGVTFMLLFHIVENIGMNIGVLPVTGIPLPLMSSGGSHLLAVMLSIGMVLNVNMRRTRRLGV